MDHALDRVRILGISGSLRTNSFSTAILLSLASHCVPAEFSSLSLADVPLYNQDLDGEPPLPAVASLRSAVAACEGVVISTPEYNHGIPGVLKNALDWASRPALHSCFLAKPVVIISSATAFTGGVRAQHQLRETLTSMLARVLPLPEIVIGNVDQKIVDGWFADEGNMNFLMNAVEQLRSEIMTQRRGIA